MSTLKMLFSAVIIFQPKWTQYSRSEKTFITTYLTSKKDFLIFWAITLQNITAILCASVQSDKTQKEAKLLRYKKNICIFVTCMLLDKIQDKIV